MDSLLKQSGYYIVACIAVAMQRSWDRRLFQDTFLGNGSVNMFKPQCTHARGGNGGVVYAVRAEELYRRELLQRVQFPKGLEHKSKEISIVRSRYQETSSSSLEKT
jgi:hypothetical protein